MASCAAEVVLSREEPRRQREVDGRLIQRWTFPEGTPWTAFYRTAAGYVLRFPGLADFEVTAGGARVRCWAAPGVTEDRVQQLYRSQVLPLALSRRGRLVLHASAVSIGRGAAAFMGDSGRGKSTLAAAFATRGMRFLADDSLLVDGSEGDCWIEPGAASLRLWEDSRAAVIGASAGSANGSKALCHAGNRLGFCPRRRRLRRVYTLGAGTAEEVAITPVSGAEALVALVRHSFLIDVEESAQLAGHFERVSGLADQPMFFRLDYPRRFDVLGRVVRAVARHARAEEQGPRR